LSINIKQEETCMQLKPLIPIGFKTKLSGKKHDLRVYQTKKGSPKATFSHIGIGWYSVLLDAHLPLADDHLICRDSICVDT
jgi:hypothetical protein